MTKLDKGTVIAAALELLNEVGMDNLTTRKLAERLKVQQPALYWHFQNKRALLDALAEAMLMERHTRSLPKEGEDWRVYLKENALSFRTALLSYRDGARIHAGTRPTEPNFGTAEAQIRFLCTAGFSPKRAVWALRAVSLRVSIRRSAATRASAHKRSIVDTAGRMVEVSRHRTIKR